MADGLSLFDAPRNLEPLHPVSRGPRKRTPPLEVALKRAVRDTLEDILEKHGTDGLSWAWTTYDSAYVSANVVFVVSDCRAPDGLTIGMVCNDDVDIDARNLRNFLGIFVPATSAGAERRTA